MPVVQNSSTGGSVTFIYRRGNVWFHMPMMHAMATAKTSTLERTDAQAHDAGTGARTHRSFRIVGGRPCPRNRQHQRRLHAE